MFSYRNIKRMSTCFLILSLVLCVCGINHAFCHVDFFSFMENAHISEHNCGNHRCNASEAEHSQHARHYTCCDSEEPHDHPEQNSSTNNSFINPLNLILVSANYSEYFSIAELSEQKQEYFTQRSEETYELLLCKDTVVLTI